MQKQGAIVLGSGGDCCKPGGGVWRHHVGPSPVAAGSLGNCRSERSAGAQEHIDLLGGEHVVDHLDGRAHHCGTPAHLGGHDPQVVGSER